ncbi:MAG: GGDEF domain-containing protein [Planctomycetales bacterium]
MSGVPLFAFLDLPLELQLWGAGTLVLTAGLAFAAGMWFARVSPERALRRARHRLEDLVRIVNRRLDTAQETCDLLARFPNLLLTFEQLDKLDQRQARLLKTVGGIVTRQREQVAGRIAAIPAAPPPPAARAKFALTWSRTPEDAESGLPDSTACETNLAAMLEASRKSGVPCGVLLVKIDRLDHLRERFGWTGARQFVRRMARVCGQALRDADLICRHSDDTFALLLPEADSFAGCQLAEAVRTAVRGHRFRLDESGPEVLVTASFGYTPCSGADDILLVLSRAGDALARSQQRGRNQLHVHDGAASRLCATA